MPRRIEPEEMPSLLPAGGHILVSGASAESQLWIATLERAGASLGTLSFTGIFVAGVNRYDYAPNNDCKVESFFLTPELRASRGQVRFLPLCYNDILAHLRATQIDVALMMLCPPDDNGWCSFGPAVDFLAELWPRIPTRIAHINPLLPRSAGHPGIPFEALTAWCLHPEPPFILDDSGTDDAGEAIGRHIAPLVPNGATLQTGLGKVPGAVLRALTERKDLRIHSGLVSDPILDLIAAGALAEGDSVTAGVAIGSARLHTALGAAPFRFAPVSVTHNVRQISEIPDFISINSALAVDLFGQAYAEMTPGGLMSGPGGASDYTRAGHLGGGLRIVALVAVASGGRVSRIVPPGQGPGPVSLGRMDIDCVVTEYGIADLRNRSHAERAAALIAVAHPNHRAPLSSAWAAWEHQA